MLFGALVLRAPSTDVFWCVGKKDVLVDLGSTWNSSAREFAGEGTWSEPRKKVAEFEGL